jgi:hypothetical protein
MYLIYNRALAALKRMDQMEATHISDVPLKANMYILDRLYDHDAPSMEKSVQNLQTMWSREYA